MLQKGGFCYGEDCGQTGLGVKGRLDLPSPTGSPAQATSAAGPYASSASA